MRIRLVNVYLLMTLLLFSLISFALAQTDSTSGSGSGGSGGTSSSTVYGKSCAYIWDSTTYLNKEVKITASITDAGGSQDSDSITVNVLNSIESGSGSARYMDGKTLDIQIISPRSDVGAGVVEIKIDAKSPYELKGVALSFQSGQGGGGFLISDRNCLSYGSGSGGSGSTIPPSTGGSGSGGGTGVPSSTGGSGGGGSGYTAPTTEGVKDKYQFSGKIGGNEKGNGDYQFNTPSDMAVNSQNDIYVADTYNNRVMIYNSELKFLKKFPAEFSEPLFITIDKSDNVYIADALYEIRNTDEKYFQGSRVRKFDKNGNLIFQVQGVTMLQKSDGSKEVISAELIYFSPTGMAVDSQGRIFLSQSGYKTTGTIYMFDSNGKYVKILQDSRFDRPEELAFDTNGNLYAMNNLVIEDRNTFLAYDNNLNYISEKDLGFSFVSDISFDSDGFFYVSDAKDQRIQIYNKSFNYISTIGGNGAGNEDNQLYHPVGIMVASNGKVYVANAGNHRISIFSPVIPASEGGSGDGGSKVSFPSICEKYYVCSDGKEVQYCFIHKIYDEQGELTGAGCGCKSHPESLCPSSSGSGSAGSGAIIPISGGGSSGGPGRFSNETPFLCDGCVVGNKCVFVGYRTDDTYCDISSEFKDQKKADASCNNNFECSTNLCIDNACVSQGLWRKILSFFKRLFGGE